jgi:hypothetical protein
MLGSIGCSGGYCHDVVLRPSTASIIAAQYMMFTTAIHRWNGWVIGVCPFACPALAIARGLPAFLASSCVPDTIRVLFLPATTWNPSPVVAAGGLLGVLCPCPSISKRAGRRPCCSSTFLPRPRERRQRSHGTPR